MGYAFQEKDSLIQLKFIGDFTESDLAAYLQQFLPHLEAATATNPLRFLVDAEELGKLCGPARKEFTQFNGKTQIGKVAIIGFNPFIKVLATFILKASNRTNIRLFNSQKEALIWLMEV